MIWTYIVCHTQNRQGTHMKKENMVPLSVRVPPSLKELAQKFVDLDAHKDISELTRDAIREKIKRDAPELYAQLFIPKEAPQDE